MGLVLRDESARRLLALQPPYSPEELTERTGALVDYYTNERCLESLRNLTPADV